MQLKIHNISKTLYEGVAQSVSVPTQLGELTILDHHIPLISVLAKGQIQLRTHDHKHDTTFSVSHGFVEVRPDNSLVILVNTH